MNKTKQSSTSFRRGATVVQLLVVIAVTAVLLGLILPAVQNARGSARRLQCTDRLRQLSLAASQHAAATGKFPARFVDLLPRLDQTALHAAIVDFEQAQADSALKGMPDPKWPAGLGTAGILACPDDRFVDLAAAESNYFLNDGTAFRESFTTPGNGIAGVEGRGGVTPRVLSSIRDGLSNTALYSERLHWDIRASEDARHDWRVEGTVNSIDELVTKSRDPEALTRVVRTQDSNTPNILDAHGRYDHILSPNQWPVYAESGADYRHRDDVVSSRPATSLHGGGVNVGFCDGRVQFVSENIDLAVWRALGTRDGKEVVSNDAF